MSWAEVKKSINSETNVPLNEQIQNIFTNMQQIRILTGSGSWTVENSGIYRIICVGGGKVYSSETRAGTVGISIVKLTSGNTYTYTVPTIGTSNPNNTDYPTTFKGNQLNMQAGIWGRAAIGCQYSYPSTNADVGVFIPGLTEKGVFSYAYGTSAVVTSVQDKPLSILGYGRGGVYYKASTTSTPELKLSATTGVIIIQLIKLTDK